MAKKKQEEPPKGSPAWMTTFSDLMNLLLCFFVLLFSMSSVDQEKFDLVITSLQNTFSILPAGGSAVGDGDMVSAGISQLENLDIYYKEANSISEIESENPDGEKENDKDFKEEFEEAALKESEEMGEQLEAMLQQAGIGDKVDIDVNAQFVRLTLNGALLFDSAKAEIREDALSIVEKLGRAVEVYAENKIDIEGHTDNVPIDGTQFDSNDILAAYRALAMRDYFLEHTVLQASRIGVTSYGEYSPVADNGTEEGRALNRRVEIKIYNTFNSY